MPTAEENKAAIQAGQENDLDKTLAIGRLFGALSADPKYRRKVLELVKQASPETPIPELDLETQFSKIVEDKIKSGSDESAKLREDIEKLNRRLTREDWKVKNNLSEDEAVEVEKLASDGKIGNSDTAVDYWRARNTLGTPRGTRKAPEGTREYLDKLAKVNPRDQRALRLVAEEEASRIFSKLSGK